MKVKKPFDISRSINIGTTVPPLLFCLFIMIITAGCAKHTERYEPVPVRRAVLSARPVMANLGGKLPPNSLPLPPRPEPAPDPEQLMVEKILETAYSQLGKPYRCGGTSPKTGFDCSGFVQWVYAEHGIDIPRTSREQLKGAGVKVAKEDILPGDLLIFYRRRGSRGTHVGIYVGDGKFIHSPHTGDVIKESTAFGSYWRPLFIEARRVLNIAPGKKLTPEQKEQIFQASNQAKQKTIQAKRAVEQYAGVYKVKSGDTLSEIAKQYGVTTESLMTANHMRSKTSLKVGQRLKVPGATDTYTAENTGSFSESGVHVVKAGETPSGIAARYGISTASLMKTNKLRSGRSLLVGQKLNIPGAGQNTAQVENAAPSTGNSARTVAKRNAAPPPVAASPERYHVVKRGEVPYNIALKYGISPQALLAANHLSPKQSVMVGQKLIIPSKGQSPDRAALATGVAPQPVSVQANVQSQGNETLHVVKKGEVPSVIAQRYGVSTKAIMIANNLDSGRSLKVGQALTIPTYDDLAQQQEASFANPLEVYQIYEVKRGDVLSSIASRYGISTAKLLEINNLSPNTVLQAGHKLRIPATGKPAPVKKSQSKTYQVKPGDSVWVIASRLDVPAQSLLDVNGLTPKSVLRVGQQLTIP